jgi:hypothetical protein
MTQRGSAATELTLIVPGLVALMLVVVLAGRLGTAHNALVGTARDAARAATLATTADAARAAALRVADASIGAARCRDRVVDVALESDPTGRLVPGSMVRVELRCVLALGDLAMVRVPGSKTVSARAVEVVDRYRSAR